jgi:hypothetical protein
MREVVAVGTLEDLYAPLVAALTREAALPRALVDEVVDAVSRADVLETASPAELEHRSIIVDDPSTGGVHVVFGDTAELLTTFGKLIGGAVLLGLDPALALVGGGGGLLWGLTDALKLRALFQRFGLEEGWILRALRGEAKGRTIAEIEAYLVQLTTEARVEVRMSPEEIERRLRELATARYGDDKPVVVESAGLWRAPGLVRW